MSRPRRESMVSLGMTGLLVLRGIWIGVRLRQPLRSVRGDPGDNIRHVPLRHSLAWNIPAPIGCADFGTPREHDGTQFLIADQRQKGSVRNRAALPSSAAARPVTRFAKCLVRDFSLQDIARGFRGIGRKIGRAENSGLTPT